MTMLPRPEYLCFHDVLKVSNNPDFLSPPSFILVESDRSFTFLMQKDLPDYPSVIL